MKRTSALVCVLVLVASVAWGRSLPTVEPEKVGLSSERLERIGQVLQEEIDEGRLPGAIVLIAREGEVAYFESFGFRDKASNAPMSKAAIFRIYSMTKPLVSVAAMILMEEGRLQLADPVSKFLPEFADLQVSVPSTDAYGKVTYSLVPAEREMTVQDLLRHTAGLAYGEITGNAAVKEAYAEAGVYQPGGLPYEARGLSPADEVVRLAKAPLVHQPGTVWEYSLASDVLGRVVEQASGMRLGDFLEQRLFGPLGMVDTGFSVPQTDLARLAEPLATDPATGAPNQLIDVTAPPANDSGGAGAVSTASDYALFAQMLLDGGALDGVRILSPTTVRLMASDHLGARIAAPVTPGELLIGTPGYTFGLGFAVREGPGVAAVPGSEGEFMWAGYAGTYFWIDPEEELVGVLMTQAPGPSRAYYRRAIKQLVYQAVVD
ncbi:MAG: serine hydrolase domain-containing protein [Geminicoccaceae bacterium]